MGGSEASSGSKFRARFRKVVVLVEVLGQAPGKVPEDWGLGVHVWGQVPGKVPEGPVVVTSSFTGLEWN